MASSSSPSVVSRMRNWILVRQHSNVSESLSSVSSFQRSDHDLLEAEEIRGRVVLYDVFISHRGSDGKSHATKIHEDLKRLGIKSFLDVEGIFKGENLSAIIVEAIRSSTVLMVILTKGFAESAWCLEELRLMVGKIEGNNDVTDQKENNAVLLPVFYGVEPGDLRNVKRGPFEKAFRMHKKGKEFGSEMIKRWEETLKEVADVWGLSLSKYKGKDELFKVVVRYIFGRVKNVELEVAKFPVAVDQRVSELNILINHTKSLSDTRCIIGIVGMTGIGKTTVATQYYNLFRSFFRSSIFVNDIRRKARSIGLANIQKMLLKELVLLDVDVRNVGHGNKLLKKHLQGSEVLLVLDDVDDISQLKALMVQEVLSPGSVILVTTSDISLFCEFPNVWFYSVEKLERHHSRELLLMHAMHRPESTYPELDVLIEQYLHLCDGLPLSLEIIGRSLSGVTNKFYWKNNLLKVSEILPEDIKRRLRYYFETLTKFQKDAVFDIACFFEGENEDVVINFWDARGLPGLYILDMLLLKNVVSLVLGRLYIHPQMKQCVLQFLEEEIKDQIRVRHLWRPNDVQKALEQRSGFTNVEYLSLVVKGSQLSAFPDSNVVPRSTIICWEEDIVCLGAWPTKCFTKMSNLKLLILEGPCITEDLINLPMGILWLRWRFYPYNFLLPELPIRNLRILDFNGGKLSDLWTTPCELPLQLQHLYLRGCTSLKSLPVSIGMLMHLEVIVLQGCESLTALPDEICNTQLLRYLDLSGCSSLENLPHNIGDLKMLQHLNCWGCWKLCALPDSFGGLATLVFLDLSECWYLRTLPLSTGSLSRLTSLNLFDCGCFDLQIQDHEKIIEAINLLSVIVEMSNLQILKLSIKGFTRLPGTYRQLSSLEVLSIQGPHLVELPWALGSFPALTDLTLDGCLDLRNLIPNIGALKRLKNLTISSCGLIELPEEIGELCNLETLYLRKCKSLGALPTSFGNLSMLKELELRENSTLSISHDSFLNLAMLTRLVIDGCVISDECLTLAFKSLHSIRDLKLKQLQNSFINFTEDALPNLISLSIVSCNNITEFKILPKLRMLEIVSCLRLELVIVPTGITMWLRELTLRHCQELSLIKSIDMLHHLEKLDTVGCGNLQYIEGLELVKTLKEMHIFITHWGFWYHADEWLQELQKTIYAPTMHFATKTVPNADHIFRNFHKMEHHNNLIMFEFLESSVPYAWIIIAFISKDTHKNYAAAMRDLDEHLKEKDLSTSDYDLLPRGNITLSIYTEAAIKTTVHEYPAANTGETIHFCIFTGDALLCEQLKTSGSISISSSFTIDLVSGWIRMLSIDEESNIETIQSEFFADLRKEKEEDLRNAVEGEIYFRSLLLEQMEKFQSCEEVGYRNSIQLEEENKILQTKRKHEEENRDCELPDPKICTRSIEDMKSFQALDIANCRIIRLNFLITVAIQGHQLTPTSCRQDLFNLQYNERSLSYLQLEIGSRTAVANANLHCHNTVVQVAVGENYESSNIINHQFIHFEASEEGQAMQANPFGFQKIICERYKTVENLKKIREEALLRQVMASHNQLFAANEDEVEDGIPLVSWSFSFVDDNLVQSLQKLGPLMDFE